MSKGFPEKVINSVPESRNECCIRDCKFPTAATNARGMHRSSGLFEILVRGC